MMGASTKTWALAAFALLGVPVLFSLFIFIAYTLTLQRGILPFVGSREWVWPVAFVACLVMGNAALLRMFTGGSGLKVAVSILYLLVMGVGLTVCALLTGCALGDCL
jgi:hypothetical protein